MSVLELEDVTLVYDQQPIVKSVSLTLNDGEIACLLGPSGCGKTTLLRAIAGFKSLHSGSIISGGQTLSISTQTIVPEKRNIGMVFQDFALFPHLTVGENICFGIRQQSKVKQQQRLQALLSLIGLSGSKKKYPHELSGGQQQRVALARAIAPRPSLLLLDEPFSSMDVELRTSLAREVRRILKHEAITAIMVTHDQHEAFNIADSIGVLNDGVLLQWDTAERLYHSPDTAFVARFIGQSNFIGGGVKQGGIVETALGELPYVSEQADAHAYSVGDMVNVLIRPEYIHLDEGSVYQARLISREFRGGHYLYSLRLADDQTVQALLPSLANYQLGETLGIAISQDIVTIFKND